MNPLMSKKRNRKFKCGLLLPFFSYPSQFTLVKLIKLKRTQSVCTEKERKRKEKRGKTERK
jgi:hypothetical protein